MCVCVSSVHSKLVAPENTGAAEPSVRTEVKTEVNSNFQPFSFNKRKRDF